MKPKQNNGYEQRRLWLGDKPSIKVKPNLVYQGDNLPLLKEIASNQIDFIYNDPPFCSQAVYKSKAFDEKIECEFNDNFRGGVASYIHWLKPRLREMHRVLKETGAFALHLDCKASHYAKIELDKIFGYKNFVNQVVWDYKKVANSKAKKYLRSHDIILIYSKNNNHNFNIQYETEISKRKKELIKAGYNTKRMNGDRYLYIYDVDNVKDRIRKGQFKESDFDHVIKVDVSKGNLITDIFRIDFLNSNSKEKLGYPTQKPLELLDRLIKTFTNKGDMVADFFFGCGTTVSSAQNLGRQWFGCDISGQAIKVIRKRMAKEHGLKIQVKKTGALTNKEVLRLNPFEFESYVVGLIGIPNKKQRGDGGIDGFTYDRIPIQVKKSYKVGRPVLDSLYKHIEQRGAGIIIAHSFSSGLIEEKNRLENERGWTIDLIETRDLLRDAS